MGALVIRHLYSERVYSARYSILVNTFDIPPKCYDSVFSVSATVAVLVYCL
jgi:hypothetical protein